MPTELPLPCVAMPTELPLPCVATPKNTVNLCTIEVCARCGQPAAVDTIVYDSCLLLRS